MSSSIKSWFKKVFAYPVLIEAPPCVIPEPAPGDRELPAPEDKKMVRLALIVGHNKAAQGAKMPAPYGKSEYEYNSSIALHAQKFARQYYPEVQIEIIFRDGTNIAGTYAEARKRLCDFAIELHFNAFNGKVTGTETLCAPSADDIDFAHIIQKSVCKVFGRDGTSRGVKSIAKAARGGGNVHSFPGGANCLVEPFFGDTPSEAALALAKHDEYAEALVKAVALWSRSLDLL